MKPRPVVTLTLLLTFAFSLAAQSPEKTAGRRRSFEFTYGFTINALPATARQVRVWIPLASSDQNQTVVVEKISSPVRAHVTRAELGDRMLYAEIAHPKQSTATFAVVYKVTRREYSKGDFAQLMRYNNEPGRRPTVLARFLKPDRLVPIDGKLKALSDENTQGKRGVVEKARALYDYVFKTMRYDKSGTGWGRGDAVWACDAKHGNCTDFHSVFIAMARAAGIPAKFEIGFPLPEHVREGVIPGYHCWAEFYVDGPGWVPVDISEAWKNPAKHDYFFGTLDDNRVQFSVGRDLILSPRQDGPPVNYFVYPYVEVDGQPYQALEDKFAFRELNASRPVASNYRSGGARGGGR
jgi:transglutaminase-like putative cysteine protease